MLHQNVNKNWFNQSSVIAFQVPEVSEMSTQQLDKTHSRLEAPHSRSLETKHHIVTIFDPRYCLQLPILSKECYIQHSVEFNPDQLRQLRKCEEYNEGLHLSMNLARGGTDPHIQGVLP